MIYKYYLQNPLYYHYLHCLDRSDNYISSISLENIYTKEQIENLINQLEQYLMRESQKQSVSTASEAVGFSTLAILISFGGSAIIEYSSKLTLCVLFLLLASILVYSRDFWKNNGFFKKTDNVIALLQHFK